MEAKELDQRIKELNEVIKNLNNSRHNPSYELENYARDLFETTIDEITH